MGSSFRAAAFLTQHRANSAPADVKKKVAPRSVRALLPAALSALRRLVPGRHEGRRIARRETFPACLVDRIPASLIVVLAAPGAAFRRPIEGFLLDGASLRLDAGAWGGGVG